METIESRTVAMTEAINGDDGALEKLLGTRGGRDAWLVHLAKTGIRRDDVRRTSALGKRTTSDEVRYSAACVESINYANHGDPEMALLALAGIPAGHRMADLMAPVIARGLIEPWLARMAAMTVEECLAFMK